MEHFNYIKLGHQEEYLKYCTKNSIIQIGFNLDNDEAFGYFINQDWNSLRGFYQAQQENNRRSGNLIGQLQRARSADSNFTWLTIENGHLYWATTSEGAEWERNNNGAILKVKNWNRNDIQEKPLSNDRLPGWLIATSQYRGTVCNAAREGKNGEDKRKAKTIQRLIQGRESLARSDLRTSEQKLKNIVKLSLKELTPKDFELLIELIFSRSGWRRVSVLGKTMKSIDLELELSTTGERAVVQIKSRQTTNETFQTFCDEVVDQWQCDKFFWVQHSGFIPDSSKEENSKIVIWNAEKISDQVIESGLTSWLGNKI